MLAPCPAVSGAVEATADPRRRGAGLPTIPEQAADASDAG
jgi:hypothetical protein